MANYRAVASGNWSSGATWGGGAVPPNGAGHSIYSNTFTVTIDTNVDVALITNAANAGTFVGGGTAAIGGSFTISNGISVTSSTINSANPSTSLINISGTASATITGNVTVASTSTVTGITHSSSGTLTFTGNSTGALGNTFSVGIVNSGNGNIIVTGNITGGGGNADFGINNTSTGTISITGLCTGGTVSGAQAVNNASTGSISITGNIIAGSAAVGANNASTGVFTVIGDITASNGANGFTSSNAGATNRLSGSFINAANGYSAIYAVKYFLNTSPIAAKTRYSLNGSSTYLDMFTADNSLGQASISDVRFGTVYASGALTGVAYIPTAGSVAAGVPVDNTVGTATLTAANVRTALGMSSANLDTQLAAIPTAVTNANAVRTNLATELGRIDATISSRSTLTAANVRTELTPELTQVTEVHKIHGLDIANALTVTPTLRSAGAITQAITGDGTTNTIVTRV